MYGEINIGSRVDAIGGVTGTITGTNMSGDLFWVEDDSDPGFGAYFNEGDLNLIED